MDVKKKVIFTMADIRHQVDSSSDMNEEDEYMNNRDN